jgi:hypothetical protein
MNLNKGFFRLLNTNNQEHFMQCGNCGEMIDLRDLGQVFEHEHNNLPKIDSSKIISKKVGDNIAWKNGERINLN